MDYEKVVIEKRNNPVSIFLEIGGGTIKTRSLVARVNPGQPGWSEWLQRHLGNTNEIWVKGRVPFSPIWERASWPREGKSGYGLEMQVTGSVKPSTKLASNRPTLPARPSSH
jgi:hypothetical protein